MTLTDPDLERVERYAHNFVMDQLPGLGLDFRSWIYADVELYGIVLGMFLSTGLLPFRPPLCLKNEEKLLNFLDFLHEIGRGYNDVPYHSFKHAVDVTYSLYFMLNKLSIKSSLKLSRLEEALLYITALGHDVLHPGQNNLFQINAKTPVAEKYNNKSVLENQSIDSLKDIVAKYDIFESIFAIEQSECFDSLDSFVSDFVSDMIITTDMTFHFALHESANKFMEANLNASRHSLALNEDIAKSIISMTDGLKIMSTDPLPAEPAQRSGVSSIASLLEGSVAEAPPITEADRRFLMKALLHAADISNPAKPYEVSQYWGERVGEEFFAQGDEERRRNIPMSPNMDRIGANQVQMTIDFIDFIVHPYFQVLALIFPALDCFLEILPQNRSKACEQLQKARERRPTGLRAPILSDPGSSSVQLPSSARTSRRMSLAAGTIDLPEKIAISSPRSPGQIFGTTRQRTTPDKAKTPSANDLTRSWTTLPRTLSSTALDFIQESDDVILGDLSGRTNRATRRTTHRTSIKISAPESEKEPQE